MHSCHSPIRLFVVLIVCCLSFPSASFAETVNETATTYSGGDNGGGHGITVADDYRNNASLTVIGGRGGTTAGGSNGFHLTTGGFTNKRSLTATGGEGSTTDNLRGGAGLQGAGPFTNFGTVIATGGNASAGSGGHGISVGPAAFTNSGTVITTGGKGSDTTNNREGGVGINAGEVTNTGTITAQGGIGGSAQDAHGGLGLRATAIRNDGRINATGGAATNGLDTRGGDGIYMSGGTFTNSGTLTATGGTGGSGTGGNMGGAGLRMQAGGALTNTGKIVAIGGDGGSATPGGYGLHVSGAAQTVNKGTIYAANGATPSGGDGGIGFFLESGGLNIFDNYGVLALNPTPGSTSHVASLSVSRFHAGSLLLLDRAQNRIATATSLTIYDGAQVASLGTSGGAIGDSVTYSQFVYSTNPITGEFTAVSGPVLQYTYTTNTIPLHEHTLTVTRVGYASEIAGDKEAGLVSGLEDLFGEQGLTSDNIHWGLPLVEVENQPDRASVKRAARRVNRLLSPHATATVIPSLARAARMPGELVSRNMRGRPAASITVATAPQNFVTASGGAASRFWMQPFVYTGTQETKHGYGDMDEEFQGFAMGYTVDTGPLVLGLSGHFFHTEFDAPGYDSKATALGATGSAGRRFAVAKAFNPWVEARVGFTHFDFSRQHRTDYAGKRASSSPNITAYVASLRADNDSTLGPVTLTPYLALDYTFVDMNSYSESGSDYALRVSADDFKSLLGTAGIALRHAVTERLSLEGRGAYHHEFGDAYARMHSRAVDVRALTFNTRSDRLNRSSGTFGAGVQYTASEAVTFGLGYDFRLGDHYTGHFITGTAKIAF